MKVAIVGSRNWPDKKAVVDYVKKLPKGTIVVSGGATGPDTWAEKSAIARGLETLIFLPEWDKWGKSAGFRRNSDIVLASERVVAFTTGSKGTAHTISLAKRYGKPVEVIRGEATQEQGQKMLFKDMEMRVTDEEPRRLL